MAYRFLTEGPVDVSSNIPAVRKLVKQTRALLLKDHFALKDGRQFTNDMENLPDGDRMKADVGRASKSSEVLAVFAGNKDTVPHVVYLDLSTRRELLDGEWDAFAFPCIFPGITLFYLKKMTARMETLEEANGADAPTGRDVKVSRRTWLAFVVFQQPLQFVSCASLMQKYCLVAHNSILRERFEQRRMARHRYDMLMADRDGVVVDAKASTSATVAVPMMPPDLVGGSSYYKEKTEDALLCAKVLGTSNSIMVTLTTNKWWPAAQDVAVNRPASCDADSRWDVLIRCFVVARRNLHEVLKSGSWLPPDMEKKALWALDVVESQLRGLLHAHMLFKYPGPPWTVEEIDSIVWARLPTAAEEVFFSRLYDGASLTAAVKKYHIHTCTEYCGGVLGRKCGCADACDCDTQECKCSSLCQCEPPQPPCICASGCVCKDRGSCKCAKKCRCAPVCRFGFPFAPCKCTVLHDRHRCLYRRGPLESRISTFNPNLLLAAKAHCHVDYTAGSAAITYITAYLGKNDKHCKVALKAANGAETRAAAAEGRDRKPVCALKNYTSCKHVSASEALLNILNLDAGVVTRWPPVTVVDICGDEDHPDKHPKGVRLEPSAFQRWLHRPLEFKDMGFLTFIAKVGIRTPRPPVLALNNVQYPLTETYTVCLQTNYTTVAGKVPKLRRMREGTHPDRSPHRKCHVWKRQDSKHLARIRTVPMPNDARAYLRTLLMHTKFVTQPWGTAEKSGLEEFTTFQGVRYKSWQALAEARGLCSADARVHLILQEHVDLFRHGRILLGVICTMLMNLVGCPTPRSLVTFYIDFLRDEEGETVDHLLGKLHGLLTLNGDSIANYDEPEIAAQYGPLQGDAADFSRELSFESLNDDQKLVYNRVVQGHAECRAYKQMQVFHLEAPGGCGKTALAGCIANHLTKDSDASCLFSAFTANAADLLPGNASTIHKLFSLVPSSYQDDHDDVCGPRIRRWRNGEAPPHNHLRKASFIVMDEITMARAAELDVCMKELNRVGFNGVVLLCGNDAQLAPVMEGADEHDVVEHHIVSSLTYARAQHTTLTQNMRMCTEEADLYRKMALKAGYGLLETDGDADTSGAGYVWLQRDLVNPVPATKQGLQCVHRFVFPTLFQEVPSMPAAVDEKDFGCIAVATRALEKEHNSLLLERLSCAEGECKEYEAQDVVGACTVPRGDPAFGDAIHAQHEATELIESLGATMQASGIPDAALKLKPCTPVTLTQTLDRSIGAIKGSAAVVKRCHSDSVTVVLRNGTEVIVPPTSQTFTPRISQCKVEVTRTQLPLSVSFACTVHRLQGKTVHRLGLDLRYPAFCHGLLYVALSRAIGPHGIRTLAYEDSISARGVRTVNVVQQRLLVQVDMQSVIDASA